MLTRDDILRAKPRTTSVHVAALGGEVRMRAITLDERDSLEQFIQKQRGNLRGIRARLVRLCCCDADGKPLFSEADEAAIKELDAGSIEPLLDQCMVLCGLKPQEIEGEKA